MLIIRANVWRLIDALIEASYSFQQLARHIVFTYIMLFTSQTMLGKAERLIESNHPTDPS